ncbi:MAG: hypothetical protein HC821_05775 [Lewinella sp.]|nr:hypothetical protein [Lewinella sp.]
MGTPAPSSRTFPHWLPLPKAQHPLVAPWLTDPDQYDFFTDKNGLVHAMHQEKIVEATHLGQALGRLELGFRVGEVKGKDFVPAPELALHTALSAEIPRLEVDLLTAQQLLKREAPPLAALGRGWHLITYGGRGLLWVKGLGHRYNNYYPAAWRIRMELA